MSRIQRLEERIKKRKERIKKYSEDIKEERRLLKKDEKTLAHIKYEDVLKKLMENDVNPDDILEKVDEVIQDNESSDSNVQDEIQEENYSTSFHPLRQ